MFVSVGSISEADLITVDRTVKTKVWHLIIWIKRLNYFYALADVQVFRSRRDFWIIVIKIGPNYSLGWECKALDNY